MGYDVGKTTDKLISVVIFIAVVVALVPTVLVYIGNISTTGIVLATAVTAIAGIMLGVFVLKGVLKGLR